MPTCHEFSKMRWITAIHQLISAAFEHSVLRVWESYALENVVRVIHCSLWAVQTINFLYTQHGMFKRT